MPLTTQQKDLNDILSSHGFDFIDAADIEEWKKEGIDFSEKLQERIREQEIIYYSKAMDYLHEFDPSLVESLELASDFGYETKDLNSEKLATIHYQQALSENVSQVVTALENFDFEEEAA